MFHITTLFLSYIYIYISHTIDNQNRFIYK